jgi:hypothetical protein
LKKKGKNFIENKIKPRKIKNDQAQVSNIVNLCNSINFSNDLSLLKNPSSIVGSNNKLMLVGSSSLLNDNSQFNIKPQLFNTGGTINIGGTNTTNLSNVILNASTHFTN